MNEVSNETQHKADGTSNPVKGVYIDLEVTLDWADLGELAAEQNSDSQGRFLLEFAHALRKLGNDDSEHDTSGTRGGIQIAAIAHEIESFEEGDRKKVEWLLSSLIDHITAVPWTELNEKGTF